MSDRPSPDWAEYSIYDNLDLDDQSCQHLPEMCGGTIPGWKYDGVCECGTFLLWEGTAHWATTAEHINWCTS